MARRCDLTGVGVMAGNNVSKSNRRTRKDFLPNLKKSSLRSDALGVNLVLKVTAKTLRTINKYGGLDSFVVNYGFNKLTDKGQSLKKKVEKSLKTKDLYNDVKIVKRARVKKPAM